MDPASDIFSLSVQHTDKEALLVMKVNTPFIDTTEIPQTYEILENKLPSVLRSRCFNDEGLPFHKEVRQTEMGHLFEHILLEYLRDFKRLRTLKKKLFKGVTEWNWRRDRRGVFYITINVTKDDKEIFPVALKSAIDLFNFILESKLSAKKTNREH